MNFPAYRNVFCLVYKLQLLTMVFTGFFFFAKDREKARKLNKTITLSFSELSLWLRLDVSVDKATSYTVVVMSRENI